MKECIAIIFFLLLTNGGCDDFKWLFVNSLVKSSGVIASGDYYIIPIRIGHLFL